MQAYSRLSLHKTTDFRGAKVDWENGPRSAVRDCAVSPLTLHPAEKFHGFRDIGGSLPANTVRPHDARPSDIPTQPHRIEVTAYLDEFPIPGKRREDLPRKCSSCDHHGPKTVTDGRTLFYQEPEKVPTDNGTPECLCPNFELLLSGPYSQLTVGLLWSFPLAGAATAW
jgi:hypothetical protein